MTTQLSSSALKALEMTASAAAAYLDACDTGARHLRLDPDYYQQCASILHKILSLVGHSEFPELLEQSAAARNAVEAIEIGHRIELSRLGFYPELALLLQRAAA